MTEFLAVGVGGFIGAVGRYYLSTFVNRSIDSLFPYGTFVVNIIGCFLIGCLLYLSENKLVVSEQMRLFMGVGILGAFTTFATFSYEIVELLKTGQLWLAMSNILFSVILGVGAVYLAYTMMKRVVG